MNSGRNLGILLPLLFLLLACQAPQPTPSPTAQPPQTPTSVAIPTPTVAPASTPPSQGAQGNILTIATRAEVSTLDVHQEFSPVLAAFGPGIAYSRLLRLKSGPEVALPSLAVECELCASWEQTSPVEFLFHLRKGVRWQDLPPVQGREVTATDLVLSYNRQRTQGWPNAGLLQNVSDIGATPDGVQVRLRAPDADFLLALADGHSKVLPEELLRRGDLRQGPVIGSGPWIWEQAREGRFQFRRNPKYFEEGLPYLETLRMLVMPDDALRTAAFRNRFIDVDEVPVDGWRTFRKDHPNAGHLLSPVPGVGVMLLLKPGAPPFSDERVRRAFFLALDPWRLNQDVWEGLAYVSVGVPAPGPDWLLPEAELRRYLAAPEQARALLREAGARQQVSLTVADFGDRYLQYGSRMAEQLRGAGFLLDVKVLNPREYAERVWRDSAFGAALGPAPPAGVPNAFLLSVVHSRGQWNPTGYRDPEQDRLVETQAVERGPEVRREQVLELQRQLLAKGLLFMPSAQVQAWAWWPRVQDFYPNFALFEYSFWARVRVSNP